MPNGYNNYNYLNNGHLTNGISLKYRNNTSISQYHPGNGYVNQCLQTSVDQISTISRPLSIDAAMNQSSSSSMHGRQLNGVLSRGPTGLHEDLDFPPTPRTLTRKKNVIWMRPQEMCACPLFRLNPSSVTLLALELPDPYCKGDQSLLAALGSLSQMPRLLQRIAPPEQNFDAGYCGMFKFRFWQYGKWVEVRIDDRLPTRDGRPAYLHCSQPDVFWVALIEKAYAKLYGGYGFLKYGSVGRALQDLTGAVVQSVPPSLPLLSGAVPRSIIAVAVSETERNARRRFGLLPEHSYSITGLARVRTNSSSASQSSGSSQDTNLIRLQSPWAGSEHGGMWGGAWSERSWEWNALSERDRDLLASRTKDDGEFWMSVQEFLARFVVIWLAHIGPEDWAFEPALHTRAPWRAATANRRWRIGFNSGGPHKCIETTAANPQFRIRVPAGHEKAHIVCAVAQSYECYRSRNVEESEIGFTIYEIPANMPRVTPQYISENPPLDYAPLTNIREIATFFALPPGDFVVLPHTIQHREGKFLLRIFADQHADVWEVNEENLIIQNPAIDYPEDRLHDAKILYKLKMKYPPEIEATQLQVLLRTNGSCGGNNLPGFGGFCGPSLELCRGLLALKDTDLGGRLSIEHVPALVNLMKFWKNSFRRGGPSYSTSGSLGRGIWASKVSSYCLRSLLWAGGVTASNKVIEALINRFARNKQITLEGYLLALVRIQLAHDRFHSFDSKAKSNPLTLEEMILMTIYS